MLWFALCCAETVFRWFCRHKRRGTGKRAHITNDENVQAKQQILTTVPTHTRGHHLQPYALRKDE